MSLRKRCDPRAVALLDDGTPNPLHCPASPRCDHYWHYDFRVNGRRYRASTETADKQKAKDIEAKERTRILEGKHGIRRQPDITFRQFGEMYLRDYVAGQLRSEERTRGIVANLTRVFGSALLADITAHRIEAWKRQRLSGTVKAPGQKRPATAIKPATVNRELDVLKHLLGKAVEWRKLVENPARTVERFKVENRRLRILTPEEQAAVLAACPETTRAAVMLALITAARIGEVLALRWEDVGASELIFLKTKNGKTRKIPMSAAVRAVLDARPRSSSPWVFTNVQTRNRYTVNGMHHTFDRAVRRSGIAQPETVTMHSLRHTGASRMIDQGIDDYTVMEIIGHASTAMLQRYTHPRQARKVEALDGFTLPGVVTTRSQTPGDEQATGTLGAEIANLLSDFGGRHEARTRDLRVANATGKRR